MVVAREGDGWTCGDSATTTRAGSPNVKAMAKCIIEVKNGMGTNVRVSAAYAPS
jgi:hypothetical protein